MSVYDGKVIKLREMGFTDEVAARSALHESLGNVDKAIDRLMAGGDSTAKAKADLPVKRESALSAGGGSLASIFQRSQPSSASSQHVQARARQLSGAACRPAPATPSHQLKRSGTSLFGSKAKSPVMNQIWLSHGHQPSTKSVASSQEDRAPEVIPDSPEAGSGLRRPPPGGTTDERRVERTSAGVHADGDVKCDTAGHGSTSAKRRKLSASAPLSERMRPEDFSGLVGQSEAAEIVRGMAESGALQSVILWGPPGCGKTTLGRMMACAAGVAFVQLSAVHAGLAEVKKVVKDAQAARSFSGRGTVLFLDEIHRFNRVQQDAFLPHVESGLVTLVGATTENPSFALNKALLSRCRVLALSKLSTEDTARLLRKAVEDPARGLPAFLERCAAGEVPGGTPAPASPGVAGAAGLEVRASDEVLRVVAVAADGDARAALNALEGALAHALRRRAREGAGGGPDGAGPAGDGAEAAGGGAEAAACSEAEAPSERRGAHAESSAGQEAPGEGGVAGREKSPDIWGPRGDRGGETDSPPVRDASSTAAETPMGASAGRGYASGGGGDGAEQGGNLDSPPFDDARAGRAGAAGARVVEVTVQDVREAAQRGHLVYDAAGDEHFNAISALHKSVRGSDAQAALYWLARMLEAGESAEYVGRRLVRIASEDVGLADLQALPQAVAALDAVRAIGMPEANLALAQATVYLALAPKSVALYEGYKRAAQTVREQPNYPVPLHLRNAPTKLLASLGWGQGYQYNPHCPDGAPDQTYLPKELLGTKFIYAASREGSPSV